MAVDTSRLARLSQKTKIGEMLVAISEGRTADADVIFNDVVNEKAVERIRDVLDRHNA
jgi:hypothetical protein